MAKGKKKKKDRRKQARAVGAAGGLGAFAGTFAGKVLERLLVQHATRFIGHLGDGRGKAKQDRGTRVLLALAAGPEPVPLAALVTALKGNVLETVDAVDKLRRARLVKYAKGRRAVHLTQHGRDLLAGVSARRSGGGAEDAEVNGAGRAGAEVGVDGSAARGTAEAAARTAAAPSEDE